MMHPSEKREEKSSRPDRVDVLSETQPSRHIRMITTTATISLHGGWNMCVIIKRKSYNFQLFELLPNHKKK